MERGEPQITPEPLGEGVWVLRVAGEHDLSTLPGWQRAFERVERSGGTTVIVDMSAVGFIDSSVVHILVCQKAQGRRLVLVSPGGTFPRRVLDLLHVEAVVPTFDSRAEAYDAGMVNRTRSR